MTKTWFSPALAAGLVIFFATPTLADEFDSVFISYDLNNCVSPASNNFEADFYCIGRNKVPRYISAADAKRQSFANKDDNSQLRQIEDEPQPDVTSITPDVEWRISDDEGEGKWKAFASIQKFLTVNEWGTKGETLVVTKVEKGSTCHIAYIDAVVTPHPYTRARKIADLCTPKFKCDDDNPLVINGPSDGKSNRICTRTWHGAIWQR